MCLEGGDSQCHTSPLPGRGGDLTKSTLTGQWLNQWCFCGPSIKIPKQWHSESLGIGCWEGGRLAGEGKATPPSLTPPCHACVMHLLHLTVPKLHVLYNKTVIVSWGLSSSEPTQQILEPRRGSWETPIYTRLVRSVGGPDSWWVPEVRGSLLGLRLYTVGSVLTLGSVRGAVGTAI